MRTLQAFPFQIYMVLLLNFILADSPVSVNNGYNMQQKQPLGKPSMITLNAECPVTHIDGKRIVNGTTTKAECVQRAQQKILARKKYAEQLATKVMKVAESIPPKPEECIKTVNLAAAECVRAKLQKDAETQPEYIVAGNSNLVTVYKDKEPVFMATRVQTHYKEKPNTNDQSDIVKKYKTITVLNRYGDVIATKNPIPKNKPAECICPGGAVTPGSTTEKVMSSCLKTDCNKSSGIMIGILNNATVTKDNEVETSKGKEQFEGDKK